MTKNTASDLVTFTANFVILANVFLESGNAGWLCGCVPRKEGGIQVLAGQAPSSQTIGSY